MVVKLKELIIKPMVTGIAAGLFPTMIILYGINQSLSDVYVKEQLLEKQRENHAALLKEKVELIEDMAKLQENYALLIEENSRLAAEVEAVTESRQEEA